MEIAKPEQTAVNDSGTQAAFDTPLTRDRSPDVRGLMLSHRRKIGANTPAGRRYSNIDEALQNREGATGDRLRRIDASIAGWVRDLAAMSPSLPKGEPS